MKKTVFIFTILYASQLYGMEAEHISQVPKEVHQIIINNALATSNRPDEAISAIKRLSALQGINFKHSTVLMHALIQKFPDKVKETIIFAIEKPELYQELVTILEENQRIDLAIAAIKEKNILQDNLKDFTILMHILNDQPTMNTDTKNFAVQFKTPLAEKYIQLGYRLLYASDSIKVDQLIKQGADINFSEIILNGVYDTPLSSAAIDGNVDLVTFLLNAGANPYLKEESGGTALDRILNFLKYLQIHHDPKRSKKLEAVKIILEAMRK
jgi:hypothetical protein